jgi:SAM-dependent methyltransferase
MRKINQTLTYEQERYQKELSDFNRYIADIRFPGLDSFYWYHTVDLGNGVVTPGDYDYRSSIEAFQFPDTMYGMNVLDVGSGTGFFAFECERRGAEVVSVELPSLYEWDIIHDEKEKVIRSLMSHHQASSPEEAYYQHLIGPFEFCRSQLQSSVRRVYSSIYDLTPEILGSKEFEIVLLGDILLHLFSPLKALDVIAPLCKKTLIIASDILPYPRHEPTMRFLGMVSKEQDLRTWWAFSERCMEEMALRVGFANVSIVGRYSGISRRRWFPYERVVFHMTR